MRISGRTIEGIGTGLALAGQGLKTRSRREDRGLGTAPAVQRSGLWLQPVSETAGEKAALGLLAAGAAVSVCYGMSLITPLVENWSKIEAGLRMLL